MKRTKGFISILLAVAVIASTLMLMPNNVLVAQSKKWDFKNINEQQAVNLSPNELNDWAKARGANIIW